MAADPVLESVTKLVKRLLRNLPLFKLYPAKVVSQASVGANVDLMPDDSTELGTGGLSGIPLALGLPGFTVHAPTARLHALWGNADPSRPRAGLYEQGCPVTEVRFDGGTKSVARVDDTVDCGSLRYVPGSPGALFYTPPGGIEVPVTTGTQIVGKITSGNPKLKA